MDKKFEEIKKEVRNKEELNRIFKPINFNQLLSMKFPENKWVIEKLIPHQGITLISGAPASFKTWIILEMAINIATGKDLFGQFKCEQNNILIIDEENHLRLIKERFESLTDENDLPIHYLSQEGFLVSRQEMVKSILEICKKEKIGVIFIDSLVRINDAEENDASQMSDVFKSIKWFCQNGLTVIITHHERKDGGNKSSAQNRLRGSSDIQASVDCHLAIRRDTANKSKITIEQAKLRLEEEMETFEVYIEKNGEFVEFKFNGSCEKKITQAEKTKNIILQILNEKIDCPLSFDELHEIIKTRENIGEKSIRSALNDLSKNGEIAKERLQRNTHKYKSIKNKESIQGSLI